MNFDHIQLRIEKPTSNANSQRAFELERFVTKLNQSRVAGGYKPLGAGFYASKMSHIETEDLHEFYKKLEGAKNFSSLWWHYCMPKK